MHEPFPEFTAAERAEVQGMNRRLRWAPRFKAPTPLGRMMIQTMLGAQSIVPIGTRGLSVSTRRVTHKGEEESCEESCRQEPFFLREKAKTE